MIPFRQRYISGLLIVWENNFKVSLANITKKDQMRLSFLWFSNTVIPTIF